MHGESNEQVNDRHRVLGVDGCRDGNKEESVRRINNCSICQDQCLRFCIFILCSVCFLLSCVSSYLPISSVSSAILLQLHPLSPVLHPPCLYFLICTGLSILLGFFHSSVEYCWFCDTSSLFYLCLLVFFPL